MFQKLQHRLPDSSLLAFFHQGIMQRIAFSLLVGLESTVISVVVLSFQLASDHSFDGWSTLEVSLINGLSYAVACELLLEVSFHPFFQQIPFVAHKTWGKFYLVALAIYGLGDGLFILLFILGSPWLRAVRISGGIETFPKVWFGSLVQLFPFAVGFTWLIALYFRAAEQTQKPLSLDLGQGACSVYPHNIIAVTSEEHYLRLRLSGQKQEELWVRMSQAQLLGQLPAKDFVQPHRSYLVNLKHTRLLSKEGGGWQIATEDGQSYPVSRRRLAEVKQAWDRWHQK